MSSFCWCVLTIKSHFKDNFVDEYQKGNISCIFDKRTNLFLEKPVANDEIFCNISCGYNVRPHVAKNSLLNNDESFFSYDFPAKGRCDSSIFERLRSELRERLNLFEQVLLDIYSMSGVCKLKLYFTETACETSLSEYTHVDWKYGEIAIELLKLYEFNAGALMAYTFEWS